MTPLQKPRLRIGRYKNEERHATWLELFYDLVFVVAVAELSQILYGELTVTVLFGFGALFIPVWWAWTGATFYATRFDTDDPGHRILTLVEIGAVAALAVNIPAGYGLTSAGFALAYVTVRVLLVIKYARAGRHVRVARRLTRRFARGFALAAVIWAASAFVPIPWRFLLWGLALAIDIATPLLAGRLHSELAPHASHLPERFGLFTIIVLGESVAAVVRGVAGHEWSLQSAASAAMGLAVAFCVWWLYFARLDGGAIERARETGLTGGYQTWLYAHLPLVMGITAMSAAVKKIIAAGQGQSLSWENIVLLYGSLGVCVAAITAIRWASGAFESRPTIFLGSYAAGIVGVILTGLAAFQWGFAPLQALGMAAMVSAALVASDSVMSGAAQREANASLP